MLYKLYLIIKIKKIKILPVGYRVYRLYKRGKIRNKISKILAKYCGEVDGSGLLVSHVTSCI